MIKVVICQKTFQAFFGEKKLNLKRKGKKTRKFFFENDEGCRRSTFS
jgi:hypothetical protein